MFESLESRMLLSSVSGFTPSEIRQAYGFSLEVFPNSSVAANGKGETIAIIDAYSDPNIQSDLKTFDAEFGLPNNVKGQPVLTIATPDGQPSNNASWAGEISLDVEWAHAIAPKANILLVEAKSESLTDLLSAVNYARSQPGVVAVSMSWGGSEDSSQTASDSDFTTPSGHIGDNGLAGGITFVAASGDNGPGAIWPASSKNVLAVGGTSLYVNSDGSYQTEQAWSDSGGGYSSIENTTTPDVAYDGDPNTGFAVYDSVPYQGSSGWQVYGGTSAGTPQWAALVAIVDQGRALQGLGSLDGATQTIPAIYSLPSADFNTDSGVGLGSPVANSLINDLIPATITSGAGKTGNTTENNNNNDGNNFPLPGFPFPGLPWPFGGSGSGHHRFSDILG